MALYDSDVAIRWRGDYRDMSNMSSMLYALEREGLDVGDRWEPLVAAARDFAFDHGSAFADAHYALVLARAGEAAPMRESLARFVAGARGEQADVEREVGLPLVEAIAGYRGAPSDSRAAMASLGEDALQRVGGSRAQRKLFAWLGA